MIKVDAITHQMIKELAATNNMSMGAYVMSLAYEKKAEAQKKEMGVTHKFDIEIAEELGVNAAVIMRI